MTNASPFSRQFQYWAPGEVFWSGATTLANNVLTSPPLPRESHCWEGLPGLGALRGPGRPCQSCHMHHGRASEVPGQLTHSLVFLVSAGISEQLGSSGILPIEIPHRERETISKRKTSKNSPLCCSRRQSFPVELACSWTRCRELLLYFQRSMIPWKVANAQSQALAPSTQRTREWVHV